MNFIQRFFYSRDKVFIHKTAIIETSWRIGHGTKIWANAHICEGATIGDNCVIGEGVYIGNNVVVQSGCRIQNGAKIYEGAILDERVFIGPNVTITNDYYPVLEHLDTWKNDRHRFRKTFIYHDASIGANSVIRAGANIPARTIVGCGSVVLKSPATEGEIIAGNPAKRIGYRS